MKGGFIPYAIKEAPPGKAGLFAMPPRGKELHNVSMCKPIPHAVNRQRLATIHAGVFRMQSRRRRWRDLQPVNAARPSMARRKHAATDPCVENQRQTAQRMQHQAGYTNSPRIALYRLCRIALYPPRVTPCKSCTWPFQTV